MAILWMELLAEWRRRLQACRELLRDGENSPTSAMLRIRERILCFLLKRYGQHSASACSVQLDEMVTPPRRATDESMQPSAVFCYRPPRPDVQPSTAFPPRRGCEMGEKIADIRQQVQNSNRQRWWWWFW
jgi:hypothetical protein